MISNLLKMLSYPFMQRALVVGILVSLCAAPVTLALGGLLMSNLLCPFSSFSSFSAFSTSDLKFCIGALNSGFCFSLLVSFCL